MKLSKVSSAVFACQCMKLKQVIYITDPFFSIFKDKSMTVSFNEYVLQCQDIVIKLHNTLHDLVVLVYSFVHICFVAIA